MRKVSKANDLIGMNLDSKVVSTIEEQLNILDENYGADREINNDLGGYVLIAENIVDIEVLKQGELQGVIAEYTDVIEVVNGENYISSLYLISSDYAIVVVTTEELSKFLLE
ncbi:MULTISPECIES: hypothetical protein [Clostridium]|uniref:hypothetical protein n=1 Tax=Clostridium TaxID=1485 RepID=UPI0002897E91|nr:MULTISPECIES: hypothetical protein [Clostridium]EEH99633.2 hypothetical protein CSBG_03259 [Clostridium sp. 7_2_43FAA]